MNKKHHKVNAFVLADSLVALTILVMVLTWLAMCENQLKIQREKMSNTLRIVRLAKESSDGLSHHRQRFIRNDYPYKAIATPYRVTVMRGTQVLWEESS